MARAKTKKAAKAERPGLTDPTAPLDGAELLTAARPVLALLREDLAVRARDAGVDRALQGRHEAEKKANRTADSFAEWRDGILAQVAASWFLSCVFVRTLEDRGLLGQARLAGPGATDSQSLFFQLAPSLTERDYLLFVFRELAELPAAADLFDRQHALVWHLSPSAEAAKELLRFFRSPTAETPAFRFGQTSTRFLGDLYQDLYEDVRKRYALLQTPDFIESFILDRTLEPAIERFGLDDTTLIDPTCGSGHFLLGAFDRLFEHRLRAQPGIDVGQAAHKALDAVYGADINPYAVAIARVRLILSYLDKAEIRRLKDAPALPLHLVVADSLLHNPQHVQQSFEHIEGQTTVGWRAEAFQLEDPVAARNVLHREYAAVVGNPPYITPKNRALRQGYAEMYSTCFMNYALSVPFCERFFQLARERGSVGQITANSFMKREFGKKLIEEYLPTVNLELIVNTSGAYIPGHGTPTVLLFGTREGHVRASVHTVLAKRGEPSKPDAPSSGAVWSSIAARWHEVGFENDYISVATTPREALCAHPWSLGGGGATELKAILEERAKHRLHDVIADVGYSIILGEDEIYMRPAASLQWRHLPRIPLVLGEDIRDWALSAPHVILRPFNDSLEVTADAELRRELWPWRAVLEQRIVSGSVSMKEAKREWFDVRRLSRDKHKTNLSIAFAFVATHNHFVLDRGGKVFKQSAPIIKLPETATEDDHLALLAYLNSSTACFWMKQVCFDKGAYSATGKQQDDPAKVAYEFAAGPLADLPIPRIDRGMRGQLATLARSAIDLAERRSRVLQKQFNAEATATLVELVEQATSADNDLLATLVAVQERIDWLVYAAFGLARADAASAIPARIDIGGRPFEGRQVSLGRRRGLDGHTLTYQDDVASLIAEVDGSVYLDMLEQEQFKRRWVTTPKEMGGGILTFADAIGDYLHASCLSLLESSLVSMTVTTAPVRALDVIEAAAATSSLYRQTAEHLSAGSDSARWAKQALDDAAIPFLDALAYTASGNSTRAVWRATWEAQRAEDRGEQGIPQVPPRYFPKDFQRTSFWQLRGKLDVPREMFISYPGCQSDEDGEPVYGWAGWDHLQRARALASLYHKRKVDEGWTAERLTPMLAGLLELLPWVKQWHNEPNAEFGGLRMGDYFEQFLDGECQLHHLTPADLEAWRPPKASRKPAAPRAPKVGNEKAAATDGDAPKVKRARKPKAAAATSETSPADADGKTDPT